MHQHLKQRQMKKIMLASILFATLGFVMTGCLKDKGFDDHQYGINDPDTQAPGVGFPKATRAQAFGLEVSSSNQAVDGMLFVALFDDKPAQSDIQVTIADNTAALVAAYNLANQTNIQVMPSNLYSVPSTTITIPAGSYNAQIPINVSNTTSLNPNISYAVGFTIQSATGGNVVAQNLKDILIIFSIKNRLDGVYEITGAALRAGDPVLSGAFGPYERELWTSGANSVAWQGTVCWAACASILPGGYEPIITVDPVTNLITNITSANGLISMTAPIIRTDIVGTTQRYDPATKTLYFEFTYGGGPTSRLFSFQARWLRAR
jgi:hypothetical protein